METRKEVTESDLELLISQLKNLIKPRISSLTLEEISSISKQIPAYRTVEQCREIRENFLSKFNDPFPIPKSTSYSEELLKHIIDDYDTNKSMEYFYNKEIKRIKRLRDVVLNRCLHKDFYSKVQMKYAEVEDAFAHYLYMCNEGLMRAKCKEYMDFTVDDILMEMKANFVKKRRSIVFNTFLNMIRRFPLTRQQKIFEKMFKTTQKNVQKDSQTFVVPVLPRQIEKIDEKLKRFARKLKMNNDIDANDGQKFLYYCNKKFAEIFEQLNIFSLPRRDVLVQNQNSQTNLNYLIQNSHHLSIMQDSKLKDKFETIFTLSREEVANIINKNIESLNQKVGNEARSYIFRGENKKIQIPRHKIASWLQLRFVYIKYLASAVLSHINYFEYIKSLLLSKSNNIVKSSNFKSRNSQVYNEILEIYDENGPFLFSSAIKEYNALINSLTTIGSYYISKFSETESEQTGEKSVIIDREALIESLLNYELKFLNEKRRLIQPLICAIEHRKRKKLLKVIFETLNLRPNFNLDIYKSFKAPYKIEIKLMNKKANVIRTFFNIQIFHERYYAANISKFAPIFDRPSKIIPNNPNDQSLVSNFSGIVSPLYYRSFDEGVPISPFEVYESISDIYKFIDLVPKVAQEMGEYGDIKLFKYGSYLQYGIWHEIATLIRNTLQYGLFPFNRANINFSFNLSPLVNSLFNSPFVNLLDPLISMIYKVEESRRLRFFMSAQKFMHLTWKLQNLICDTNLLQESYYSQCDQMPTTANNADAKKILLTNFKERAKDEIIDHNVEERDINQIDFALLEFEEITLDFNNESSIKNIIFGADFSELKKMIKFQKLHNTILEIALRHNRHITDSDFFVSYFELGPSFDTNTFVTGVKMVENEMQNIDFNSVFYKQLISYMIFYQSTNIYRDNQLAHKDIDLFSISIREIKMKSRTILSAQYKQKNMTDQEIFDLYLNEMTEAFSSYAYRNEISHICNLERQLLMSNSFVDTFIIGPDPSISLVNQSGYMEKFFYVPTWVESYTMMSKAPKTRQTIILKNLLEFIKTRYRILNMIRHECSLSQNINTVLDTIYNQKFHMETPIFQKLSHELNQLENSQEVEIATKYILEKEKYLFHRFEYSILNGLELFFLSTNTISNAIKEGVKSEMKYADPNFGEILKQLWKNIHKPLSSNKNLVTSSRYIPLWEQLFVHECNETDRSEIATRIESTDNFLDIYVLTTYKKQFNNNETLILPYAIDFLILSITQYHIKFAYFLLLSGIPEDKIDINATVMNMNYDIFQKGYQKWDEIIVQQANEHLVPKDESPSRIIDTISEPKLAQAVFDVVRTHIDIILLSDQINQNKIKIQQFSDENVKIATIVQSLSKPDFISFFSKDKKLSNHHNTMSNFSCISNVLTSTLFYKTSEETDKQFLVELNYAHKRLIEIIGKSIDLSVIQHKEQEFLFDTHMLEETCYQISSLLETFTRDSLNIMNATWKKFLSNITSSININHEEMEAADVLAKFSKQRSKRRTDIEVEKILSMKFLSLNKIYEQMKTDSKNQAMIEAQIEKGIREYYEQILADLQETREKVKATKELKRKKIFDKLSTRVTKVKNFTSSKKDNFNVSSDYAKEFENQIDEDFVTKVKNKNEKMRKQILMMRVFKCLNEIAVTRIYSKQINSISNELKITNQKFYKEKLQFEYSEEVSDEKLLSAHEKLSSLVFEINNARKELENAKLNNIQLVHWKAKNSKNIDQINKKIASFQGVGDVNISNLMRKLDASYTELDQLRDFGSTMESEKVENVYTPLTQAFKCRTEIRKAIFDQVKLLKVKNQTKVLEEQRLAHEYYERITEKNNEIKQENALLREKINELEKQKAKKSENAQILMEQALHSRIRSKTRLAPRTIVRPGTAGVSRPQTRAYSRM